MFWIWISVILAFLVAGWFAHKKLRQLSDDNGPRSKRPPKPLPRRKDLSGDLREALSRLTFYGAFTPTAFMLFSIFRRTRQKEWWQDVEPLPKARHSGPWDTPETLNDDVVDIVEIDYDIRKTRSGGIRRAPEKD